MCGYGLFLGGLTMQVGLISSSTSKVIITSLPSIQKLNIALPECECVQLDNFPQDH